MFGFFKKNKQESGVLPDNIHSHISKLCADGDAQAELSDFKGALTHYAQAWSSLPDPKTQWTASTWILVSISDMNFQMGEFHSAKDTLTTAMQCPDAIGNPFIHLRLGQCLFEVGELDHAADELIRAYMSEGSELFQADDPKYLQFLATRADGIELT
jgi:hypothetical protein